METGFITLKDRQSGVRETLLALLTISRGPAFLRQVIRRVYETHMGEGLRKIAHKTPTVRIILLREQADVIAQPQQPLKERGRLVVASHETPVVRQPECARKKHAFTRWKAIELV